LKRYEKCFKGSRCFIESSGQTDCLRVVETGSALVDWLVESGQVPNPVAAVALGQRMGDAGLLLHITSQHDFEDTPRLLYTFQVRV